MLTVVLTELWLFQENLHDVQSLRWALPPPGAFLVNSLICCSYHYTQKPPPTRVFSSPPPQVILGKKSLKTLPAKLPPLPFWLVTTSPIFSTSVGSNAGLHFSPYSAFKMLQQETGFCVCVCKPPSPGESLTFSLRKSWCHD